MGRATAYIGLGSNLGDRVEALEGAVRSLDSLPDTRLKTVSSLYETSPVKAEGGPFLNAVAVIDTGLAPEVLLKELLKAEGAAGRTRGTGRRPAPRRLDLDLLLYGKVTSNTRNLVLPHPRMLGRRFVMEPLAEVAPDLEIPAAGVTAAQAAEKLLEEHPEQQVRRLGTLVEAGG